MNKRAVLRVLGFVLGVTALAMLAPVAISHHAGDRDAWSFLVTAIGGLLLGGLLWWAGTRAREIRVREGFAVVTLGWLGAGLLGALPAWLSGQIPGFTDAVFESISGFTTTGATILTDIEGRSRGLLFWRALSQWLGGMGIVLLVLAILPMMKVGGMQLFRAEVPGPLAERLTPRISQTAKLLWCVYLLLTLLQTGALALAGLSIFDAVCHAFTTMATGGFSPRNESLGAYANPAVHWIVIVFMFLAGANFTLHFQTLRGKVGAAVRDDEFRFYFYVLFIATALICVPLFLGKAYPDIEQTLRHSIFQTVSIITTTGFTTADYALWPPIAHSVLLVLMVVGGCAGSTAGGIKIMRLLILLKATKWELRKLVHPRAVSTLWYNERALTPPLVGNVLGFLLLFLLVFIAGVVILTLGGRDLVTALGATAATLGVVGPGLGTVGPAESYAHFHNWEKWFLMFLMLAGRLELYTVLALMMPETWRRG
jgi:trk system potassium uptake protein